MRDEGGMRLKISIHPSAFILLNLTCWLPALEPVGIADHRYAAEGHGQRSQERREQYAEEWV